MIKCMVCQKEYENLSSHIRFKHNMLKADYAKEFPGSPIVSSELSNRFSKRSEDMHKTLKEKDYEKYIETRRKTCSKMREIKGDGFTHTDETKEKMSAAHLGKPGTPHTEESKRKIRQKKLGKKVNLSEEAKAEKTKKQKERWQVRKEDTESFQKYLDELSERRKDFIKENGRTIPKKGRKTNIEKRFSDYLEKNNIEFIYQYFLSGKYFDFYIPSMNLLIEVDGEYWHRFPASIRNDLEKHFIAKYENMKILRITHLYWTPELIFETEYSKIQQHNYNILNNRTKECQNYEISISIV